MDPKRHLELIVEPNLLDFLRDPTSERSAFNVAAAADSLAAHMFWWCLENKPDEVRDLTSDDSAYRNVLAERDISFELLRDVAKAQKHVRLERGKPLVKTAGDAIAPAMGLGPGSLQGDEVILVPVLIVNTGQETPRFEAIARRAIDFLKAEMRRHGSLE